MSDFILTEGKFKQNLQHLVIYYVIFQQQMLYLIALTQSKITTKIHFTVFLYTIIVF